MIGTKDCPIDAVGVDEFRGGYLATPHLMELGHSRIGIIVAGEPINPEKLNGYKAALKEARRRFEKSLTAPSRSHSIAAAIDATSQLMNQQDPPTAIFATSDVLALGALRWAAINNISVPSKLAIVGFDDTDTAEHSFVALTTVHSDVEAVAKRAVARLIELMKSAGSLPPPRTELIECEVVARESTMGRPRRVKDSNAHQPKARATAAGSR